VAGAIIIIIIKEDIAKSATTQEGNFVGDLSHWKFGGLGLGIRNFSIERIKHVYYILTS
jgi:hypothetical protein